MTLRETGKKFGWRDLPRVVSSLMLALASRIIPRSKSIWVIGGSKGLKYGDNSMHFFKYCTKNTDKRVVWLAWSPDVITEVRAEGHEAYRIDTARGLWLGLRAKWHVFDVAPEDTGMTSRGAYLLNLWHGVPLKDIRFMKLRPKRNSPLHWIGRRILADKDGLKKMFFVHPDRTHIHHILESFDLLPKNIIYANLPRNAILKNWDRLTASCKASDLVWIKHVQVLARNGARVIGYFPTWGGGGDDKFLGTLDPLKITEINDFLKRQDLYILTKWHDCVFSAYGHSNRDISAENFSAELQQQSNIVVLPFESDLNSHLPLCDILITDYSSVFFDYLLLERPIIFFAHDVAAYKNRFGFFFEYEKFVPGNLFKNTHDLFNDLAKWNKDPEVYSTKFEDQRREYQSIFFECSEDSGHIINSMLAVTDAVEQKN